MLNSLSIGKRLGAAFALVLVLLALLAAGALDRMSRLGERLERIVQVYSQAERQVAIMDTNITKVQRSLRSILLTDSKEVVERELAAIAKDRSAYEAASQLLKPLLTTGEAMGLFGKAEEVLQAARAVNTQVMEDIKAGRKREASQLLLGKGAAVNAELNERFQALSGFMADQSARAFAESQSVKRWGLGMILTIALAAIVIAILAAIAITRSITHPIRDFMEILKKVESGNLRVQAKAEGQDEVAALAASLNGSLATLRRTLSEVAQAATSVASGATQLSATAEEMAQATQTIAESGTDLQQITDGVASAMMELSASVEQVAGNVQTSLTHSGQAVQAMSHGAQGSRVAAELARVSEGLRFAVGQFQV